MAFLNGANDEPSRPTTAQSKGRLVLQVTDFLLANKVAVVSIHEIQHAGQGSSSPGTTARPTSVLRTESSTSDSENPAAAEVTGFYVTAMDEVENEYALYISRQKAEYLYRVECENAVAISDNGAPVAPLSLDKSSITLEDMATSILAHLDIIGNRHRDIGKLTCREPQAPVMKKARVMSPAKNASAKHKNAHFLQAKRQDQRAARSLQTAVRTMEAIASAHQRGSGGGKTTEEEELSPRTRKARKSSEYRLLSRMAAADSKTIWKSELESIHDDPSFRAIMEGICKDDFVTSRPIAMLDPIHSNGNKHVSSTAIHRRALPEKKTKHKELQERREKGRNARLHITRATSSSALHDIAASVVVAEPATTASTLEEFNSSNSSQRSLAVAPSSQRLLLATMNSIRGINALTGNMYSMKALEVEEQQQEQETFLRKRSISSSQKRVLKADSLFNEMPGMGVEITNERPVNRGSLSLLGSARGDDLMREVKLHVQENARRSSLVRDENGNLRRRSSLMCSTSRKMSLPFVDDAGGTLATSASAPELSRKEEDTELENQMEARSPRLKKIPTPRRVGSADNTPRQSACDQADDVNPSLFVTTGAVSSDSLSPRAASSTERAALGCDLADSVPLSPRYEPDGLALGTATPRSSRIGSTATASHIIEIQESESEQYNDSVGEEGHDDNTVSSELNGAQQAPTMCAIQSAMSAAVASPRQACWGDESLNEEGLLSTPLSPRILPCVEPTLTQQQTPRGLVEVPHLYRKSGALELRTRSLDQFPAKSSVTSELFQRAGEEILFDGQQDLRTKSLDRVDAISTASFHPSHTEDASNNVEDTAASATLILSQERVDWVNARPAEDESADVATHDDESECEINRGSENVSVAAMERTGLELVDETQDDLHDVHNEHYDEQEGHQSNKQQNDEYKVQADQQMDQEALTNEVVLGDDSPLSSAKNVFSLSETQISNAHIMTEPMRKKSTAAGMGARRSSTKSSSANITALQSLPRDSSKSPSKKSKYAANSSAKVSSSGNKRLSEHRKSSLVIPAAFHEVKDAGLNGFAFSASRKSIVKATTSHHISGDQPDIAENGSKGKASRSAAGHTKCASSSSSLPPSTAFLDIPSAYHKKWGKWLNGRFIVDKISCLQLEELVLRDPQNERHLVKLGLRYARWSETSFAAILLLEHASLMGHEIAALRSHEYWNAMGNAHFNLFLRHRKFLPICQFHLEKALRAFTRAFAFMESMADPLLLLRYAICLFWQRESVQSNLEKADDVFRDLRAKFATFCDKDRPNLLFLHFQILCRLHMYQEAAECMKTVLNLLDALPAHALDTDNSSLRPTSKLLSSRSTTSTASISAPYDTTDYMLMLMHSQQSSGDYAQASATFSAILKARHMLEADEGSSSVLHDDQYLEIWYSLAEKCFFHEEHPLALDFYSIALNFAKDSHVLASIHFHRGLCYQAIGDDANCVTEYKRARNLNRHVAAPVAIAELHAKYTDQFAVLLQKSIKLVIDEVRVLLYDKAVKKLQRIFRRKQHQQKQNHTRSAKDSVKKPHLKRTVSSSSDKYDKRSIAGSEMTGEDEAGGDNNGSSIGTVESTALSSESQQHARFLTRQRAAQDKIRAIRSDPQFQPAAQHSPLHSPASVAATRSRKIKSMPNDSLTHSALLSPEMEHPELRRKQSMETFHKLGYVPTTMVSVTYWECLLVIASDLYETQSGLYRWVACVRNALPHVTDAIAYCALAECAAQVDEAIEKLHDPTYEREVAYVCTILDVQRMMMAQQQPFHDAGRAPSSTSSSASPRSISSANSSTDVTNSSAAGVRFPAIASNDAHHSPRWTSGSQAPNAHATTPRRVVLPYFGSSHDVHGAKSAAKEKPLESHPSRLTDMLDAHFQERKHATSTDSLASGLHALGTETVTVLHDFRDINNVALLSSQQPFGAFMN